MRAASPSAPTIPAEKTRLTREEINRKQKEFIFPSVTNYYSDPVPMDRGVMQHVWDVEGKKYLDFFGGIVTISVGHCNPRVTSRTKAQIDRLQHVSTCFPNEPMVTLAEKLAQITPGALKKSYFTNSGTEANETAIQMARMHTGNFEVVALRHGYSGRSSLARGLNGINTWRKGTIEVGIVHAINPYCYRCPFGLSYPSCGLACVKNLEHTILGEGPDTIAEVIVCIVAWQAESTSTLRCCFSMIWTSTRCRGSSSGKLTAPDYTAASAAMRGRRTELRHGRLV